ncbi:Glycosyltransferase [Candidatus Sulfotelmatobacter kueseliae]|uniref:Glycosyltransferase n=1 Tax=Candidatus Sulfotelmatobacter kueseliae TaxID=2042962 RepID=A0A2U3KKV3_9BACT|nr:Glycosyltransferase [Candidatus Sulfotelmatobacter kueseliae]
MVRRQQYCGAYVLLTAAYNEEAYIERTIQSVVSQTLRPRRWVIVDDDSTDRSGQIVQSYAEKHDFIKLLRVTKKAGHSFAAKVVALRKGEELLRGLEYDFIGNLDADLSLEHRYFEELIRHFLAHPELGLAGGFVYEDDGNGFRGRWFNSVSNVSHAAQLVRRQCYEGIGGYAVLKYGGEDWYAQTCAKMKGWQVESIPRLKIFHHRHTGASSHPIRNAFRLGRLDYSFGSDPMFEVVKCLRRLKERPRFVAAMTRLLGFAWCYLSGEEKAVPAEFAAYLRKEQRSRVSSLFSTQTFRFSLRSSNRQVP